MSHLCLLEGAHFLSLGKMYIEAITKIQHDGNIFRLIINLCM